MERSGAPCGEISVISRMETEKLGASLEGSRLAPGVVELTVTLMGVFDANNDSKKRSKNKKRRIKRKERGRKWLGCSLVDRYGDRSEELGRDRKEKGEREGRGTYECCKWDRSKCSRRHIVPQRKCHALRIHLHKFALHIIISK